MTNSQAILAGAVCVALAVFATAAMRPATAMSSGAGQFQLMNHSNTSTNVGIFRIDTVSGDVSFCYLTGATDLVCTKPAR